MEYDRTTTVFNTRNPTLSSISMGSRVTMIGSKYYLNLVISHTKDGFAYTESAGKIHDDRIESTRFSLEDGQKLVGQIVHKIDNQIVRDKRRASGR